MKEVTRLTERQQVNGLMLPAEIPSSALHFEMEQVRFLAIEDIAANRINSAQPSRGDCAVKPSRGRDRVFMPGLHAS